VILSTYTLQKKSKDYNYYNNIKGAIMSEKTITIKNDEKKISLHLSESPSRHGWSDYSVRIYGDGPNDSLPGARPFKVFTFPVSHEVEHPESRFWTRDVQHQYYEKYSQEKKEEALEFMTTKVKEYQSLLGEKAQIIEHTSLMENLVQLKDNLLGKKDDKKNNNSHKM
jgi:hypothetical protein